jgi:hypothetical protein
MIFDITAGIVIGLATISGLLVAIRNAHWRLQLLPAIGWVGTWLTIGAIVMFDWILPAPPGTLERNADWLASHTAVIEGLKQLPGFSDWLSSARALTGADVIRALDHPVRDRFLDIIHRGQRVNGLQVLGLLMKVRPVLVLAITFGGLVAMVGGALNLRRLLTNQYNDGDLLKIVTVFCGLCGLTLISYLPILDTLGNTDDFVLKILISLAEVEVASGGWWMVLGLFLTGVSAIGDWFPGLAAWRTTISSNGEGIESLEE